MRKGNIICLSYVIISLVQNWALIMFQKIYLIILFINIIMQWIINIDKTIWFIKHNYWFTKMKEKYRII